MLDQTFKITLALFILFIAAPVLAVNSKAAPQ